MKNNFDKILTEGKALTDARKEAKKIAGDLNKIKSRMESLAKKDALESKIASRTINDFAEDLDEMIVNLSVIALGEM